MSADDLRILVDVSSQKNYSLKTSELERRV